MVTTRRGLLAAVPATVAVTGCSFVSDSGSEDRPPYAVENESGAPRNVDLRVWKVGQVDPFEERADSFREEFESAAANGSVDDAEFEWTDGYDLTIEPGAAAAPLESSSATGLLYVRASADHGERIGVWVEVEDSPGDFFVDVSVYENGMSATAGEY